MTWQETPYTIPLPATAGLSVALVFYALRHRSAAGLTILALHMLAATAAPLMLLRAIQHTVRESCPVPKPLVFPQYRSCHRPGLCRYERVSSSQAVGNN